VTSGRYIRGDEFSSLAEAHWRNVSGGLALRNMAKRQVSRVSHDGKSYIVKTYRLGFFRRVLGLRVRSFECLDCLDGLTPRCVIDRIEGNWQFTVFEDAGGSDLFKLDYDEPRNPVTLGLFSDAGRLLAEIHGRNVYHGDTKTPNFVVNENSPALSPVVIVDCDRLRQYRELPIMRRAFNLAQFIESAPSWHPVESVVSHLMAFCRAYRETSSLEDAAWRSLFMLALDIAENNRHIERMTSDAAIRELRKLQGIEE